MRPERRRGAIYSACFHLLFLLFAVLGLPSIMQAKLPEEPHAITVELLPISQTTNVRPSEAAPAEPQPEKVEEKKTVKPSPPVKTSEPPPPPPPDKIVEKKEKDKPKKEEKKKEEKKEEKKKPKEDDLAAVLRAVRETAEKDKKKIEESKTNDKNTAQAKSDAYNSDLPMSLSEKDAIRSQISKCWIVPAGAKDAHDLIIVLKIELEQNGSLIKVELANESKSRYSSDSFFSAAADSAMRAVRQCSPLQGLPPEKFQTWREIELTFNPKEMLF